MMRRVLGFLAVVVLVAVAPDARAVEVQRVVSPAGIEAWLVEDPTKPIVSLRFAIRGGAALDALGKEGLAEMAMSLLDEGAGDLGSQAFQRTLDDLAIDLSFRAGRDTVGGTLRTLTENRERAFALLGQALVAPRFDAEPVARIRSQLVARLESQLEDPDAIAGKRLRAALFEGHAYGRPRSGTLDSLAAITAEDLRAFARGRLVREGLYIGVVGDVTAADLGRLLDTAFAGLPARGAGAGVPDVRPKADGGLTVIDKAVPQSTVLFAQPGMMRDDPDFYAASVMMRVLGGGGFTSRLYREVRETRGLAYGVWSGLVPFDHAALVMGSAGTENARVAETVAVVRDEWRKMAETGATAEEVADAKLYLTGSYPLRFTSTGRIAGMLVGVQLEALGIDYFERRNALIEAVTLADVNRVAAELLDPDTLTFVVVGQPEGLETTN